MITPLTVICFKKNWLWEWVVFPVVKNLPANAGDTGDTYLTPELGGKIPLEDHMATHSSIPVWSYPRDRRACWATVHRVVESWTWLKWLSAVHSMALEDHLCDNWRKWILRFQKHFQQDRGKTGPKVMISRTAAFIRAHNLKSGYLMHEIITAFWQSELYLNLLQRKHT